MTSDFNAHARAVVATSISGVLPMPPVASARSAAGTPDRREAPSDGRRQVREADAETADDTAVERAVRPGRRSTVAGAVGVGESLSEAQGRGTPRRSRPERGRGATAGGRAGERDEQVEEATEAEVDQPLQAPVDGVSTPDPGGQQRVVVVPADTTNDTANTPDIDTLLSPSISSNSGGESMPALKPATRKSSRPRQVGWPSFDDVDDGFDAEAERLWQQAAEVAGRGAAVARAFMVTLALTAAMAMAGALLNVWFLALWGLVGVGVMVVAAALVGLAVLLLAVMSR